MLILEILLLIAFLLWMALAIFLIWATRGATILRPGQTPAIPERFPKVSILVPARNEEGALPAALESFVALDYPAYEVIVIDDASTDVTGRIADDWAARPASRGRVQVIHNKELPAGWAGKVHALSLAARVATGEWILATDADVVFHPELLKLAVSLALEKGAQLVSVMPEMEPGGFWEKVVLPAFSLLLATLFPARLVNRPGFPRAIAAGAFILMRRRDLEDLGGYEALKNVVNEDLRMAERFKKHGRCIYLAASRGLFHTRMYSGLQELWEGLSRSAFEGVGYSVAKVFGGVAVGIWVGVLPWVASVYLLLEGAQQGDFAAGGVSLALALGTCFVSVLIYLPVMLFLRVSILYVFTLPLAALFYSGVALNSMCRSLFGSGVSWKGRNYRPSE
ncbi:MAG TPA: glycosyltransferase [Terriglobia bacterium]|nr:glycosyltransferase [Terriglobia bacterium]